jgi:formylmethanofuran dehydrogenase subunit D
MISLTIVACHDVFQRLAAQRGILTREYQEHSATVSMSAEDMKALGIGNGAAVKLSNDVGSVILRARRDGDGEPGFGYMPTSLYANMLASYEPARAKLPNLKHIEVIAEPSNEAVTPIAEVWQAIVGKGWGNA